MIKQITCLIVMLQVFSGCKNANHTTKLYFPAEVEEIVSGQCGKGIIFIYYHSGNCSVCYGTILYMSEKFPDIPFVSITTPKDTSLINHFLEEINFNGTALNDGDSVFFENNKSILAKSSIFLTDSVRNIIASARFPDPGFIKKITGYLKKL